MENINLNEWTFQGRDSQGNVVYQSGAGGNPNDKFFYMNPKTGTGEVYQHNKVIGQGKVAGFTPSGSSAPAAGNTDAAFVSAVKKPTLIDKLLRRNKTGAQPTATKLSPNDFTDIGNPVTWYDSNGKPHQAQVVLFNSGSQSGKFGVIPQSGANTILFSGDSRDAADQWLSARSHPGGYQPPTPQPDPKPATVTLSPNNFTDIGNPRTWYDKDGKAHQAQVVIVNSGPDSGKFAVIPQSGANTVIFSGDSREAADNWITSRAQRPAPPSGGGAAPSSADPKPVVASGALSYGKWQSTMGGKEAERTVVKDGKKFTEYALGTKQGWNVLPSGLNDIKFAADAPQFKSEQEKAAEEKAAKTKPSDTPPTTAAVPVASVSPASHGAVNNGLDRQVHPADHTYKAMDVPVGYTDTTDSARVAHHASPAVSVGYTDTSSSARAAHQNLAVPVAHDVPVGFTDTTSSAQAARTAPAYSGGADPVKVEHLKNGATLTTTATGAEIEQMPGHSAYQVKAAQPTAAQETSAINYFQQHEQASTPVAPAATVPAATVPTQSEAAQEAISGYGVSTSAPAAPAPAPAAPAAPAPAAPAPAPAPSVSYTDTSSSAQTPKPAPTYTGGAKPVEVKHLKNGATLTTTATGAEIEQMPGHSAYQVKAPTHPAPAPAANPGVTIIGPNSLNETNTNAAAAVAPPRRFHVGGPVEEAW